MAIFTNFYNMNSQKITRNKTIPCYLMFKGRITTFMSSYKYVSSEE